VAQYSVRAVDEFSDSEFERWWANPETGNPDTFFTTLWNGARPSARPPFKSHELVRWAVWFCELGSSADAGFRPGSRKALPAVTYIESVTVDRKEFAATR